MNPKNPKFLLVRIQEYIAQHSGFEPRRDYLSMSHLSECPRKIVEEYFNGYQIDEHTHRMAFAGYEHEMSLVAMLRVLGMLETEQVEVVAPFDPRLRGHMDGVWEDSVIEIKSVSRTQYEKISKKQDKVLWKHFIQVQMYMHYSGLHRALVFYRNRETYEHMIISVGYHPDMALKFEEKARMILEAIDENRLPECECGKCKE